MIVSGYIYEDEISPCDQLKDIEIEWGSVKEGSKTKIFVNDEHKLSVNPLFNPLLNADGHRYVQNYGGRGSGKSFIASLAAVLDCVSDYNHNIFIARWNMNTADVSTVQDVKMIIAMLDIGDEFNINKNVFTHKNGNKINFWGLASNSSANSAKNKSLSGITRLYIEESEDVPTFEDFSKIDESIRSTNAPLRICLTYNPTTSAGSWIHQEWFNDGFPMERDDTLYLHTTYHDNLENLDPTTVKRYEDLKITRPTYYTNTILAEWTLKAEGTIYNYFDFWPAFHDKDESLTWYGFDPNKGGSDCAALVRIDYFDDCYFVEEVFCESCDSVEKLYKLFEEANKEHGIHSDRILCDSENPMLIESLNRKGYNTRPISKTKDYQRTGISLINGENVIIVGETNQLKRGYATWKYEKDGTIKMHEPDALAALRYAVTDHMRDKNKKFKASMGSAMTDSRRYGLK